jgi:para-nitrobenzyl esterase
MSIIDRRNFLSQLALATASLSLPGVAFSAVSKPEEFVEVEVTHGKIRGVRNDGVNIFKGIPYAGKVSGDRRFRRPAPLEPWTGVREALQLGAPAIQAPDAMNQLLPKIAFSSMCGPLPMTTRSARSCFIIMEVGS